ncbi:MAG: zinc dependent phospholipase C family protein [Nitrospirae bacterium]|nr:zinc dependent phospholipase C family protein [Nitrospirota bacterium]
MLVAVFLLSMLFIPSLAHAWGPLTHAYLGYQVLDMGAALIPVGVYRILKKYKNDFIYGNLSADIIFGRRFQGTEKSCHSWSVAWKLLDAAKTDRQKAFAYGYLAHLCADTVVHNLDKSWMPFKHSLLEVKSESIIDKKYRRRLKGLDKVMQKKHDLLLEDMLERVFFSFKTNKRIFKGLLLLSRLPNYAPLSNFIDNRFPYEIPVDDIYKFRQEALLKTLELLNKGKDSSVVKLHPLGRYKEHPLGRYLRKAS